MEANHTEPTSNSAKWQLNRENMRVILSQRSTLATMFFALLVLALSQSLLLFLVGPLIKALFAKDVIGDSIRLGDLLPNGFKILETLNWQDFTIATDQLAFWVPFAIVIAGIVKGITTYYYQLSQESLSLFAAKSLREKLFSAIIRQKYTSIRLKSPGEWSSQIMNDVLYLQTKLSDILTAFIRDLSLSLAAIIALFFIHWPSAVVLAILAPFMARGMGRAGKRIAYFTRSFQRRLAKMAAGVLDIRRRFDFIRAQKGEEVEVARFQKMNRSYYEMISQSLVIRAVFGPSLEFFGFVIFASFFIAMSHGYLGKDFSAVNITQLFAALGLMLKPMRNVGEQWTSYKETWGSLAASMEMLNESHDPQADAIKNPKPNFPPLPAHLLIRKISAGHDGKIDFSAVDLQLVRGNAIALIGPSGAGKSTFIKVLSGLIEPDHWESDIQWREVVDNASLVSQEPFLFDDTIYSNLVYGLAKDKIPSSEVIWGILESVNLSKELGHLPQKLQTGFRGIGANLSGGQIQRLVIARALIRDKSLLLLDEATSAIDASAERDILESLLGQVKAKKLSMIVVTHRMQCLDLFDEVWFAEAGGIILKGPHSSLLADRRYAKFISEES